MQWTIQYTIVFDFKLSKFKCHCKLSNWKKIWNDLIKHHNQTDNSFDDDHHPHCLPILIPGKRRWWWILKNSRYVQSWCTLFLSRSFTMTFNICLKSLFTFLNLCIAMVKLSKGVIYVAHHGTDCCRDLGSCHLYKLDT